eukprot:gnl/MRDRNA2_/MRDRNA2_87700_c0_seq1.p1 gnl/MRDRNA2_/MRDRNA2_87700_c0~~gnl/MRDRNA2_/MRDRNA2_87700_c0_seq1.p1  ORF type:complete len:222 (-),score=57.45 gnl/MRDRNA2_/MRDRNA2_87700_c0_seq1:13-678(-)
MQHIGFSARMISLLLLVSASFMASATRARDADLANSGLSEEMQAGVQGAMLLSAALPEHGPTPGPKLRKKMETAGPLIYDAYTLFQTAAQNVEATQEQLKLGLHTETASSNLASGELLVQQGTEKLNKGKKIKDDVEAEFQASADPLGAPPEPSKSWGEVDAMTQRAQAKLRTLHEEIKDAKQQARESHISLISVESAKAVTVDSWAQKQDDKLLDFLAKQ